MNPNDLIYTCRIYIYILYNSSGINETVTLQVTQGVQSRIEW